MKLEENTLRMTTREAVIVWGGQTTETRTRVSKAMGYITEGDCIPDDPEERFMFFATIFVRARGAGRLLELLDLLKTDKEMIIELEDDML